MELHRINDGNFKDIIVHPVYIVGYQEKILTELCAEYDILSHVEGVVDAPGRKQGAHDFLGKELCVMTYNDVTKFPSDAIYVIANDFIKESTHYIEQMYLACNLPVPPVIYFYADKEMALEMYYRRKYQDTPLQNIIVFWSGPYEREAVPYTEFGDNSRALFEYMLSRNMNETYKLVWLVSQPNKYRAKYEKYSNVYFLPSHNILSFDEKVRDEYFRTLCLAKYIFTTDGYGFARNSRQDQIRVQLWHGQGFKSRVNLTRCEYRYDYMTVGSEMYAKLYAKTFGLRDDQMIISGQPREDWLFHPLKNWAEVLDIPSAGKYIFWLPTFRSVSIHSLTYLTEKKFVNELPIVKNNLQLQKLNNHLAERNICMVIKLHPFQRRDAISNINMSNIIIIENDNLLQKDVQIHEIIGHADALISDYSSLPIDYTVMDRPIAFTMDDYKEYGENRGFNWDNIRDWLPGEELFDFEDFLHFVDAVAEGKDNTKDKRRRLTNVFHAYRDDNNSQRVLSALGII